jgi:dolichol-phosphate mannosyltransferase
VAGLGANDARIHLLRREGKLGLGTAYLAGFRYALERDYERVFEMDADFSHDPGYLRPMLEAAETADMVVGSRYVEGGGTRDWGVIRQFISRGGGTYARLILGMKVRDLTAGFICYRRETLERIDLSAVTSTGYAFQIELKYRHCDRGAAAGHQAATQGAVGGGSRPTEEANCRRSGSFGECVSAYPI